MSNDKEKIKYPRFLNKLWYDPVWSKVIYAGILFVIGVLYSFFSTLFKNISFYDAFIQTINYSLKLYLIFIILVIGFLIYAIVYKIRKKRKSRIGSFDVEQPVGYYTFRELYNALLTHKINLPPNLTRPIGDKKGDLLTLFVLYQRQLNIGAEWNHDNFTYYILGPTLMTYGLTEKAPTKNKLDSVGSDIIQTSEMGFKFYALLEKWRVYNDERMKEDITKTGDTEPEKKKE